MKIWKRNAVIVTLLLFVCVAVFLNWQYNRTAELDDYAQFEDTGSLFDDTLLAGESGGETAGGDLGSEDQTAGADDANDYFSTARLSRQKSRDAAHALLEEAVSVSGITQEVVDETSAALESMAVLTVAEATVESLIIAKGFEDCVAFASDDSISIVVAEPSDGFTVSDIAKITDVVTTELGYTTDQIKIVGV